MRGQISFVNVAPLDQAVPPTKPVFSRKRVILLLVLAAGFGLAVWVVLALLIEIFDRRIRTSVDLDHATGLYSIGTLVPARVKRERRQSWLKVMREAVELHHEPSR